MLYFIRTQWNATAEPDAPDRSSRSPDSVEIQMDKSDGRVQCYHCQHYYFQNFNFCPHCGMRNKLRQYAQAKQKDPGEELVDSAVAAGSAVARGIGRGLMSGFKMAKQAAENSNKKKGNNNGRKK